MGTGRIDEISRRDRHLNAVQHGIRRNRGGGEMIDLDGEHASCAGFGSGDRDKTRASAKIEYRSAGDLFGMVEEVAGERLAADPDEGPERRWQPAAREAFLGGLPDRSDLGGEVKADLRHQWRRRDRGIAADEDGRIHGSGGVTGDDPGQHQPADRAVRAELGEAIGRIVDRYPHRLPGQLQGGSN